MGQKFRVVLSYTTSRLYRRPYIKRNLSFLLKCGYDSMKWQGPRFCISLLVL